MESVRRSQYADRRGEKRTEGKGRRKIISPCCLLPAAYCLSFFSAPCALRPATSQEIRLDTLDTTPIMQEWGEAQAGKSVGGHPLRIGGREFAQGVGTHAASYWVIALQGAATRFTAQVGVDEEEGKSGSVSFEVWVDGERTLETPILRGGDAPYPISVDVSGAQILLLLVNDGGDGISNDHADWADAMLTVRDDAIKKPVSLVYREETPPALWQGADPPQPQIHGPRVTGATPGRPFLFRIPATGTPPLKFAAKNLPAGLTLDATTGIITGSLQKDGTNVAEITVTGPNGKARRKLAIVGGKGKIAQTPPLGWNSWNVWGTAVDDARVRAAADAFESTGLAAHGFTYINIDDGWEANRTPDGVIQANGKFPSMLALSDYLHNKGLKFGIYSSPGPKTCGDYTGSYQHEAQDAKTYAAWGVDYLKYDWCSYGEIDKSPTLDGMKKPYAVMQKALADAPRDILYSLCQYGMGNVWTWGSEVGGNAWRTTGDITDSWGSMSGIGFGQNGKESGAAPGHWNDPDMLVVGYVGWGPNVHPTGLRPHEQMTHITLWSLLAAPMLLGCDLTRLDTFTRALLLNDEVLDINQDPLGKQARRIARRGMTEIWSRPLFDGTLAVGLFNRGPLRTGAILNWPDLGLRGPQPVRDLWQRKDLGRLRDSLTLEIPAHGALLLKIGKPKRTE